MGPAREGPQAAKPRIARRLAIARLLQKAGASHIVLCDSRGILSTSRTDLNPQKREFAIAQSGTLADALVNADVFLPERWCDSHASYTAIVGSVDVDADREADSQHCHLAFCSPIACTKCV